MRVNKPLLCAWIICTNRGHVEHCHCTCVAGLGEACSHVAALLFHSEFVEKKKKDASVTDVPAYWRKGPTKVVSPKKVSELPFVNARKLYVRTSTKVKRPLNVKKDVLPKRVKVTEFLKGLEEHSPNSVLLKLVPPFFEHHLPQVDDFPLVFSRLYKEENSKLPVQKLIEIGKKLKYDLTEDDLKMIEEKSREQSHSAAWRRYRTGRITASVCREACHVKSADSNISLIKRICYPSGTRVRKKAILWGCNHEKDALSAYLQIEMEKHINLNV